MRRAAVVQYQTAPTRRAKPRPDRGRADRVSRPGSRGLDYQVFRVDDGVGFLHVAAFDGTADPFADSGAYREFHRELEQRLATPPIVSRAALIGSYSGASRYLETTRRR